MDAVDCLKRDHQTFRATLSALDAALHVGPEAWPVLRGMCFTLSRRLQRHMQREEVLMQACRHVINPRVLAAFAREHQEQSERLRTLNRCFGGQGGGHVDDLTPAVMQSIHTLRSHLEKEEAELFPVFEQALQALGLPAVHGEAARRVHKDMTVNRVLHDYPATRPVFTRLCVSAPDEGCACLDEVAWRHGMDSQELLRQLERAAASSAPSLAREGAAEARGAQVVSR